jgi:hypothetical protein
VWCAVSSVSCCGVRDDACYGGVGCCDVLSGRVTMGGEGGGEWCHVTSGLCHVVLCRVGMVGILRVDSESCGF